jgi:hypothetical protein
MLPIQRLSLAGPSNRTPTMGPIAELHATMAPEVYREELQLQFDFGVVVWQTSMLEERNMV